LITNPIPHRAAPGLFQRTVSGGAWFKSAPWGIAESKSAKAQESVLLFDRIIANMESGVSVEVACLSVLDGWHPKSDNARFFSRNM
jgi:hypothetical protein